MDEQSKKDKRQSLKELPEQLKYAYKCYKSGISSEALCACRLYLREHSPSLNDVIAICHIYNRHKEYSATELLIQAFEKSHDIKLMESTTLVTLKTEALLGLSRYDEAVALSFTAGEQNKSIAQLKALAICLKVSGQDENAIFIYQALVDQVELTSGNVDNVFELALLKKATGDIDGATYLLQRTLQLPESCGRGFWELANLKSYKFTDDERIQMIDYIESYKLKPMQMAFLFLALGRYFEDNQDYAQSFNHYHRSKNIFKQFNPNSCADEIFELRELEKSFTPELLNMINHAVHSDVTPIFIIGMHRSGSTLVEQILSAHPMVDGTHELTAIPQLIDAISKNNIDISVTKQIVTTIKEASAQTLTEYGQQYLNSTEVFRKGAPFFTDKLPQNFKWVGFIQAILPNAKFIDVRRHPLGTGLGIYRQIFSKSLPYTDDLYSIGEYYNEYIHVIKHWKGVLPNKIKTIIYEDLVENTEKKIKSLLAFCGLPFNEQCLSFYDVNRSVKTPSAEQVRQPIYTSAVEQWKNYEPFLQPLKEGLGDALFNYQQDV